MAEFLSVDIKVAKMVSYIYKLAERPFVERQNFTLLILWTDFTGIKLFWVLLCHGQKQAFQNAAAHEDNGQRIVGFQAVFGFVEPAFENGFYGFFYVYSIKGNVSKIFLEEFFSGVDRERFFAREFLDDASALFVDGVFFGFSPLVCFLNA